jgi:peroxiredoxin
MRHSLLSSIATCDTARTETEMTALRSRQANPGLRPPLAAGDIAPQCVLPDSDGDLVNLRGDRVAGNPIVVVFCPRFTPAVQAALTSLAAHLPALTEAGARLFAVTREPAPVAKAQNLPFPVLIDSKEDVFRAFSAGLRDLPTTVMLRPNHHVLAIFKEAAETHGAAALAQLDRLAADRRTELVASHPPVLLIPDVLSPAECRRLINVYNTRGQVFVKPGIGYDDMTADYKMRIPEYDRVDRIDHWLVDKDTCAFVHHRVATRVFPEIVTAFQYWITKYERMRIGCYEGARGGRSHGHRDNIPPTAYRRFALSINLNTDEFDGGELRFPEFGDKRYRPASGTAIVFSSSLLHEALQVTRGRRLVLLAFLFGEH